MLLPAPTETGRNQLFPAPLVVYKVGGSLLDLPGLADLIESTLAQRSGCGALLVAGGGAAADVVRDWDRRHHLGDETAHDLAIEAMGLTELLLSRLIPALRPVRNRRQLIEAVARRQTGLLCAGCFLRWGESTGFPSLMRSWRVTSDSIAAWTARLLEADELVLLKSVPVPAGRSFEEAARAGLVDLEFPRQAASLPRVSWLNARGVPTEITPWQPPPASGAA